jgi:indole-3-glycerol phosphate synthase
MTILDEIFAHKRQEVQRQMAEITLAEVQREAEGQPAPRDFSKALRQASLEGHPALIAEVKHRSPSRGVLAPDFDPQRLAEQYQANGASAISVLTDAAYFGGSLDHLRQLAKLEDHLPLLRKDFIFHPYQLYQARAAGADAVLLIAAMLDVETLAELHNLALQLGLAPLVEVHTASELNGVIPLKPPLLGVNNRDLHTFKVSLQTTLDLSPLVPEYACLVAESGIRHAQDVNILGSAGVDAVLVGEALVTAPDLPAKVRELAGLPLSAKV